MLSKLYIIHLQQEILSVANVLTEWKIHSKNLKIKYNLFVSTLAIMYNNNLTCQSNIERKIIGGQLPIMQVLSSDMLFKDKMNYHLQRHNIYFLSQIMAADGIRLLIYSDLQLQLGISTKGHKLNWYKQIEQHCIINIAMSRKVKPKFIINRQYYLQDSNFQLKI
ncbi:hypothetical protein RclHR1_06180001 [Rhizophagus clarus]|uniref:Uncharacterized protein n=1 Tax=Rhizophagus clarus TaxID=94130 RepID=A0A2Z6RR04_9GLOM|nr:hypothetical protein RclHR1_06180001 [Rhizophagus clarus]